MLVAHQAEEPRGMPRAFSDGDLRLSPNPASIVPDSPRTREPGGLRMLFLRNEPTKAHWKPDAQVEECYNINCRQVFSFFERKHHCRRCGNIFCSACCSYNMKLSVAAEPSPTGKISKVCRLCFEDSQAIFQSQSTPTSDDKQVRHKSLDDVNLASATKEQEVPVVEDPSSSGLSIRRRTRSLREHKTAGSRGRAPSTAPPTGSYSNGSYPWSTF